MDEGRSGLEGGVDRTNLDGIVITPRAPRGRSGGRATWGRYRPASGRPPPVRLSDSEFAAVRTMVSRYEQLPDTASRASFRASQDFSTLPEAMRKKFWYLYFRARERKRSSAYSKKTAQYMPERVARAAYQGGAREGLRLSKEAMSFISVHTSPFIRPSDLPVRGMKVPTKSNVGENSACVCVRAYRSVTVTGDGSIPFCVLSSPNPCGTTFGLPAFCSFDFEGSKTDDCKLFNLPQDPCVTGWNPSYFEQIDMLFRPGSQFRPVGHGLKLWISSPTNSAATPGDIYAYNLSPSRFHSALSQLGQTFGADDPLTYGTLPGWVNAAGEYTEHDQFGLHMDSLFQKSSTNPDVNMREANKGVTVRWAPPDDSFFGGQPTEFCDGRLVLWYGVKPDCTLMAPPALKGETLNDWLSSASPNSVAFSCSQGLIKTGAVFPFAVDQGSPVCTLLNASTAVPLEGYQVVSQSSLNQFNANGDAILPVDTAVVANPDIMDQLNFGAMCGVTVKNLPAGSVVTMQLVWHFESSTTMDDKLNSVATPQVNDPGWPTIWNIVQQRGVFPFAVNGHSFWDDAWSAIKSAASDVWEGAKSATRWVTGAVDQVANTVEHYMPMVEAGAEIAAMLL